MRNQHPGVCYRCGKAVAAGAGHFERIAAKSRRPGETGKWRLQHADCAIEHRGTDTHVLARAEPPNEDVCPEHGYAMPCGYCATYGLPPEPPAES